MIPVVQLLPVRDERYIILVQCPYLFGSGESKNVKVVPGHGALEERSVRAASLTVPDRGLRRRVPCQKAIVSFSCT